LGAVVNLICFLFLISDCRIESVEWHCDHEYKLIYIHCSDSKVSMVESNEHDEEFLVDYIYISLAYTKVDHSFLTNVQNKYSAKFPSAR